MSETTYFEGATYDFFVKPVQFREVVQGEFQRHWVEAYLQRPDAWTVYHQPRNPPISMLTRKAITDFFDPEEAAAYARQLALENKTEALLRGHPTD